MSSEDPMSHTGNATLTDTPVLQSVAAEQQDIRTGGDARSAAEQTSTNETDSNAPPALRSEELREEDEALDIDEVQAELIGPQKDISFPIGGTSAPIQEGGSSAKMLKTDIELSGTVEQVAEERERDKHEDLREEPRGETDLPNLADISAADSVQGKRTDVPQPSDSLAQAVDPPKDSIKPAIQRRTAAEILSQLGKHEIFWRDHSDQFESRGYRLRPRFRPGWVASWTVKEVNPVLCDDYVALGGGPVIDATRVSDGVAVFIKRVEATSSELDICRYFSELERSRELHNHCVPIYDDFPDDADRKNHFIVMPLLRAFDDPPFSSVDEVIEFMKQTLEGLVFIHKHNVAHRDCSGRNIMMLADQLFPGGFHPYRHALTPDLRREAKPLRRRDVMPMRYYFIDFGISTKFEESDTDRRVLGKLGLDKDVPELDDYIEYEAFPVDVFILGNVYRQVFVEQYVNLDFLKPLTDWMTQQVPAQRPTSEASLKKFNELLGTQSSTALRWRLQRPGEASGDRIKADAGCAIQEMGYRVRKFISVLVHFATSLKRGETNKSNSD